MIDLRHGDCCDVLTMLPAGSVQAVVTSPPYYALRDYGLPPTLWPTIEYTPLAGLPPITIPGCDPDCDHEWGPPIRAPWANANPGPNGRRKNTEASRSRGESCNRCGGWRGALGLEPDPLMFVAHLVHIFRLVWDVLRDDGTCWLNLGDSYSAGGNGGGGKFMAMRAHKGWGFRADRKGFRAPPEGLKEKDLLGIPWRVAYALQADGWYLRAENIWHKPNGMPEGATDRTTRAHEQVFLLTKSERYYYDAAAVAQPATRSSRPQYRRALELARAAGLTSEHFDAIRAAGITDTGKTAQTQNGTGNNSDRVQQLAAEAKRVLGGYYREFLLKDTRNLRSVWTIAPTVYGEGHFAVMPDALVEPCILAGTSPQACPSCGAPWERVYEATGHTNDRKPAQAPHRTMTKTSSTHWQPVKRATDQRQPSCDCADNDGSGRCTVLDPFAGTFTVGKVAQRFGRKAIGIELNQQYLELADRRTNGVQVEMEAYL